MELDMLLSGWYITETQAAEQLEDEILYFIQAQNANKQASHVTSWCFTKPFLLGSFLFFLHMGSSPFP